jgi:hypothetical protein
VQPIKLHQYLDLLLDKRLPVDAVQVRKNGHSKTGYSYDKLTDDVSVGWKARAHAEEARGEQISQAGNNSKYACQQKAPKRNISILHLILPAILPIQI